MFELENGNYYYVKRDGDKLMAGGVYNCGILPEVIIDYDENMSLDGNLERLYEAVVEYDTRKETL